jgi:hypothetical protein
MPAKWSKERKVLFALFFPVAFLCLLPFLPIRMMAWPFFLLTMFFFYFQFWRGPKYLWIGVLVFSVVLSFMPFDVSTQDFPGPPRFVPLVTGYTSMEGAGSAWSDDDVESESSSKGDVIVRGRSFGNDPKWIWVW